MPAETDDIGGRNNKVKLKTLDDLDRRTLAARAVFELRDRIHSDLGGVENISAMEQQLVTHVCLLGAMLNDTATSYLQGKPVDLMEYQTLTNAQRRLMADLGLQRRQKEVNGRLDNYLKQRANG